MVGGRTVNYVESSPRDQLQPKLHSYPYLKAGDEIPIRKPRLFEVAEGKEVPISDQLFPTPWDIDDIRWANDSSRFTFLYNQRGHQVLRIIAVDAKTGEARPLIDEQSKTFVDYSGKMFVDYLDDSGEIVWMSERDGWNQLYLYDAKTGEVKNQITKGEWVVRGVDQVDRKKRQIWFRAGGIRPGQDPCFVHYCRVNFDGSDLAILTEGNGNHAAQFSPDRRFLIDTWSRVDSPSMTELRSAQDGRPVCKLEEADASEVLAAHGHLPEPFVAKGRDGQTDIYGVIFRPKDFDPSRKYPVIENIYAGPQDSYVAKSFRPVFSQQELADHGFVVVQIDGMGTSNRSKKFHDVCWKNLGDAGFPDRILWMKAAAAKYPQLDLTRVGIYGTSAGGQSALGAMLFHGDFYTCAVSDSGCHDNRMDKIWWNEQWMGWPVGPEYAEQSNVTHAKDLRGPLLLMFGEDDENVDPASTLQVVNALIKADKKFDLLEMPGQGHGVLRTAYGRNRMLEFFQRNLLHSQ
jgi:dipeptidyl aminopeptidase/acylaminoacyl peptidase